MKKNLKKEEMNYTNVDINKKNLKEYEELMQKSSYKYDSYFNSNNPLVRILLLVLFIIIVFGVVYYLINWALL